MKTIFLLSVIECSLRNASSLDGNAPLAQPTPSGPEQTPRPARVSDPISETMVASK